MRQHPHPLPGLLGINRRQRQCSAWIALLSMVLIFAGPILSNVQALMARSPHTVAVTQPANDHHGGHQNTHHKPTNDEGHSGHHQHSGGDEQGQMLHASCGYCTLLFHTASLSLNALTVTVPERWAPTYQNASPQSSHYTLAAYSVPQGRAPPRFTV